MVYQKAILIDRQTQREREREIMYELVVSGKGL